MADWEKDLDEFLDTKSRDETVAEAQEASNSDLAHHFINEVVLPAFHEVRVALENRGRLVQVSGWGSGSYANIKVHYERAQELDYTIKVNVSPRGAFPYYEDRFRDRTDGKMYKGENILGTSSDQDVTKFTVDDVRKHLLEQYKRSEAHRR
jgi:hypothetical protein